MADQTPDFADNQQMTVAIESAEQFLMLDENLYDHHPLLDDFVSDMLRNPDQELAGEYGARFSGVHPEENFNGGESGNLTDFTQRNWAFGNPLRIPIWPVPPSTHNCTCCQTLREFIHANGAQVLKLDVHGRLGLISHAVLERYNCNNSSENHEYYMFDFCQESISSVKQFLIQYCEDRKREGYVVLQDPLSNFYNALCIGIIDGDGSPQPDVLPPQTSGGDMKMNQGDSSNHPEQEGRGMSKSYLASQALNARFSLRCLQRVEQRTRTGKLNGICRKWGLHRWPYRKIKSFKAKISRRQQRSSSDPIQKFQTKLAKL